MDISAKIRVPEYVYRFYQNAAKNIAGQTTEQTMSDALAAYAALLDKAVSRRRNTALNCPEESSAPTGP